MGAVTEAEIEKMSADDRIKISQGDVRKMRPAVANALRRYLDIDDAEEDKKARDDDSLKT